METKYIAVKTDCMWNGNCYHKLAADSYKMQNFFDHKFQEDLSYLCNQDYLLDRPESKFIKNEFNASPTMNDFQTSQSTNYYQPQANYSNQFANNSHSNDTVMTNHLHQPNSSPTKVNLISSNHNSLAISNYSANNHHLLDSSLNSSSVPLIKFDQTSDYLTNDADCFDDINLDEIEDDLDLMENVIEAECCTDLLSLHHAELDLETEPCAGASVSNDHSYGASTTTIEKITPLMANSSLTNGRPNYSIDHHSPIDAGSPTKLIQPYDEQNSIQFVKFDKRQSLARLQAPVHCRTVSKHHHSGTSLLTKSKQSKPTKKETKKEMDVDRREEHNKNEKQRRGILKSAFSNLANQCVNLQGSNKKPSRIQTLNEAASFIRTLQDEEKILREQMQLENRRKATLERKLNSLLGHR